MKLGALFYYLNTLTKMLNIIMWINTIPFYHYFVIQNVNILHELYSPYIFFPRRVSPLLTTHTCNYNKIMPCYLSITHDKMEGFSSLLDMVVMIS